MKPVRQGFAPSWDAGHTARLPLGPQRVTAQLLKALNELYRCLRGRGRKKSKSKACDTDHNATRLATPHSRYHTYERPLHRFFQRPHTAKAPFPILRTRGGPRVNINARDRATALGFDRMRHGPTVGAGEPCAAPNLMLGATRPDGARWRRSTAPQGQVPQSHLIP